MPAIGRKRGDITVLAASASGFLKRFVLEGLGSQHTSLVCHGLRVLSVHPKKQPGYIVKQTGLQKSRTPPAIHRSHPPPNVPIDVNVASL